MMKHPRLLINVSALIQQPVPLGILPIGIHPPRKPDWEKPNKNYQEK